MKDQTIRIQHRRSDTFARIPHDLLENPELSAAAKGILCYLLSKPDAWMARVTDIVNHMTNGKSSVRNTLNELREAGYAHFEQRRDGRGRLSQGEWSIADSPVYPRKSPRTRNRYADNPDTENRHLSKNESSKKDFSKNKTEETKGTTVASQTDDNVNFDSTWKPNSDSKEQKLAKLRPPSNYPTEREFDAWLQSEEVDHIINFRDDLYRDLCLRKWHHWYPKSGKWKPIADWRKYVLKLNEKMDEAHSQRK